MTMNKTFSNENRNELIKKIKQLSALSIDYMFKKPTLALKYKKERRIIEEEYINIIPIIPISCCPFCNKQLFRKFDFHDIDGGNFKLIHENKPKACEHFYLLTGSINYNGLQIPVLRSGTSLESGPEVPFVYLREIKKSETIAVISQINMTAGYTAYPIVYFSKKLKKIDRFAPGWDENTDTIIEKDKSEGWDEAIFDWDFNLKPWLEKGKIKWCEPNNIQKISNNPIELCPYININGIKKRILIEGTPDGKNHVFHYDI